MREIILNDGNKIPKVGFGTYKATNGDGYKAGMNWHISKPIKVDELMSALTEILK